MQTLILTSILAVILIAATTLLRRSNVPPTLPGPKGLPLIGNTLQISQSYPWQTYISWIKTYGPLVFFTAAGKRFLLIGSAQAAHDILSKNAKKNSNRPHTPMAQDLVSKGMHILLRNYDSNFVKHQRMYRSVMTPQAATSYAPIFEQKTSGLLRSLLRNCPSPDISAELLKCNLGIVYALTYGMHITTGTEAVLASTKKDQDDFKRIMTPGAYLVDIFPSLNLLPSFLAPWKHEAEILHKEQSDLYLSNLSAGLSAPGFNFTKHFSSSPEAKEMSSLELAYSIGVLVNAAYDTTSMTLEWVIQAALTHPNTVRRAHAELDAVIGRDRLPCMGDKQNLPYLDAFVEEAIRWRTILASGFPHVASEDDGYNGYIIRKGTIILPVIGAIDHDASIYPNPELFSPDRWLEMDPVTKKVQTKGVLNSSNVAAFGYGRRACPGKEIARRSLWLTISRLFWAFTFSPALDDTGNVVAPDPDAVLPGAFNSLPKAYRARLAPRGDWVEGVLNREASGAESTEVLLERLQRTFAQGRD